MAQWLVALAVGLGLGALQYGARLPRASLLPAALLRCAAVALLVALLLDAPAERSRPRAPLVALDASASWRRAGSDAWKAALDSVRAAQGDTLLLFGDSVRVAGRLSADAPPTDAASQLAPVVERAAASGRSIVVVTDGELDDPDAATALPSGSRIALVARAAARDAGLSALEGPRAVVSGDTLLVRLTVVAGAAGAGPGELAVDVGGRALASARIDPLPPYGERTLSVASPLQAPDGPTVLRAVLRSEGDVERRNDTLATVVEVSRAAGAVFVSTAPDLDGREALAVLRGALSVPARGYWRVAPGQWRLDGTLAVVAESDVRRALREAPVAVIHGDTAALGAPRSITGGALALVAPPTAEDGEWYASGAPASPLAAALSGMPWDSLPPLQAGEAPRGDWVALEARLARSGAPRPFVTGRDEPRRVAVVAASGLWRWRFRGGASADAFAAVWGALFDWLLAGGRDPRPATPELGAVREGEPVRWRRGVAGDSLVRLTLARRSVAGAEDAAGVDTVTLRFPTGASVAESPPLVAGVYDVTAGPGRSLLVVNPSREWLPRQPRVRSMRVRGDPPAERAPGLRSVGWAYAAVIGALCLEWLLRRRRGLR